MFTYSMKKLCTENKSPYDNNIVCCKNFGLSWDSIFFSFFIYYLFLSFLSSPASIWLLCFRKTFCSRTPKLLFQMNRLFSDHFVLWLNSLFARTCVFPHCRIIHLFCWNTSSGNFLRKIARGKFSESCLKLYFVFYHHTRLIVWLDIEC